MNQLQSWLIRSSLTFLVLLLALTPRSSTLAMPPEFSSVFLDATFPIAGCDFPIEARLTATLKVFVHFDQNGDFKMLIERVLPKDSQSIYTNLETGASISSSHGSGIDKLVMEEDGTITFMVMGVFDILPVPGQGLVVQDVGRIVFDASTGEILFSAGQFTVHGPGSSVEGLCGALE